MRIVKNLLLCLIGFSCAILVLDSVYTIRSNRLANKEEALIKPYVDAPSSKAVELVNSTINQVIAQPKPEVILLTEENTISFNEQVTDKSVSEFQKKILDKSNSLDKNATIYLVINSPGGSIVAGNRLIDTVAAVPQKVKTISLFSASMAFQMVQNMDERLITPSGTVMSHRAAGGFEGEFGSDGKGELMTQLNWVLKIIKSLDEKAASRMQMKLEDYQYLIRDQYWVSGKDAVKDHAVDRVVLPRCDKKLIEGTNEVVLQVFILTANLTYSNCPLITYPLEIKVSMDKNATPKEVEKSRLYLDTYLNDKESFVRSYIVHGEASK